MERELVSISFHHKLREILIRCSKIILTFDQREAGAAESKLLLCKEQKNFWSGSLASKSTFEEQNSMLSQKEKSLASKLADWRPFILKSSNGCGGLNF